jgi:hypothetical protein
VVSAATADSHTDAHARGRRLIVFARLRRDNKGASVVTYALILPLFIVLVFGILEIWRVMAVRQSLHLGVYQSARGLSSAGRQWLPSSAGRWEANATGWAHAVIDRELKRNTLLPQGYTLRVQVEIEPEARADLTKLGWFFTVRAELTASGLVTLPPLDARTLTLTERQVSYIEGISGSWVPPEEGPAY